MGKRGFQRLCLIVLAVAGAIGCYDLFSKYFEQKEQIRLRTLYYLKTGQILDIVQDEFREGDIIESNNTTVAEVTDTGGIKAKNPGRAQITVTKQNTTQEQGSGTPETPQQNPSQQTPPSQTPTPQQPSQEEVPTPQEPSIPQEPLTDEEVTKEDEIAEDETESADDSFTFEVEVREPVQGLRLSVELATLVEGDTLQLTPVFTPANAFNKNVTYASFQTNIASVSSTGLVSALHAGTATIQATSEDGGFQSRAQINVLSKEPDPLEIIIKEDQVSLLIGETQQIHAAVSPDDSRSKDLTYRSENPNVFTVDNSGTIKAIGPGTARLQVSIDDQTKSISVTVKEREVESVQISPRSLTMKKGETKELSVIISPYNATNKSVVYSVDNSSIASVQNGKVKALSAGKTSIHVRASNGKTDTCVVEVIEEKETPSVVLPTLLTVSPSSIELTEGESTTITAKIEPSNATNQTLTYTSTDSSIVSVDSTGHVYGRKAGQATIRVMTSNSLYKDIPVRVRLLSILPSSVAVSPTSYTGHVGETFFIAYRIYPDEVTEGGLTFSSSNTQVASVAANGKVSLNGVGTAIITARTVNDKTATVTVTVTKIPPKISIDKTKFTMNLYENTTIKVTISPDDYKNATILYTSSNPNVVKVDEQGKVSAVGVGSATITAIMKEDPSVKVTSEVTVNKIDVTKLQIKNMVTKNQVNKNVFVVKGKSVNLNAVIEPKNATYDKINWKIKDTSIATVSDRGVVTGVKKGNTELTLTVGGKSKVINIAVEPAGDKVYFASLTDKNNPEKNIYSNDAIVFKSGNQIGLMDTSYNEGDYVKNGVTVAGDKCQTYINFLNDLGVSKIDFVILTHYHADHTGCFTNVLKKFDVDKVYWKKYNQLDRKTSNIQKFTNKIANWKTLMASRGTTEVVVSKNTSFSLGNFKFKPYNTEQVLAAKLCNNEATKDDCSNNVETVSYLVTSHNKKLYFAGDIQNAPIQKKYPADDVAKKIGKVDFLKVAHHAYYFDNNSETEINALQPKYAVVTNDTAWLYRKSVKNRPAIDHVKKYTGDSRLYYTNGGFVSLTLKNDDSFAFLQGSWK